MTDAQTLLANDPWWLMLIKVVVIFVFLLTWTIFNVWFERKWLGKMQDRRGPNMNGPFGLGQALADGLKLLFKEDFRPAKTDRIIFNLAPWLTAAAAFTMWTVIPIGGEVSMFGHQTVLQVSDLPVGTLFILAISSIGIYGIVLAGWASNGTYSLLGSMRATAQLISYEVAMGLSVVAVFMVSGSMSTSDIVNAQSQLITLFGQEISLPGWYALLLIPSFVTYVISMFGETNRTPFDLAECESELVSGHITDFSGFRYALYFLAEYINMGTVSAVATTLFLGGYRAPYPFNTMFDGYLDQGWFGPLWFLLKVQGLIFFFVWVRASVPRFRYDQFMVLGWKVLIPANMVWIMVVAVFRSWNAHSSPALLGVAGAVTASALAILIFSSIQRTRLERSKSAAPRLVAPSPGSYPVPPRPGEQLPELAGWMPAAIAVEASHPAGGK
ncbi:MAG: NADH-quinone oxidoreductase subunit NuoH [Propionibacteriaceae bacterium]|jgi:NADH-quinone oxidoreductase subunit H|nr:NADH-quinone oxidoreductase subunit NuoH [Propionibacteriaceae bacterium]